ncbi:hypothetical protein HAX54_010894, partial [Datura stramonium]|nr:hypothetical protein [Datura stramonium]
MTGPHSLDDPSELPSPISWNQTLTGQVMVRRLTDGRQLHHQRCDGSSLPPSPLHP